MTNNIVRFSAVAALLLLPGLVVLNAGPQSAGKILAQKLVEEEAALHPEIIGLELAASRSQREGCATIAATEPQEIGQKCDKDELTAMHTNRPFVEKEQDGFDVAMPLHDPSGKVIGSVGMDFKPEPGQQRATVVKQAKQVVAGIEKRFTAKTQLFEPAN